MRKSIIWVITFLSVCLMLSFSVSAEDAVYNDSIISSDGFTTPANICDGTTDTYSDSFAIPGVTVTREGNISSLYIVFDKVPGEWTLTCVGKNESNDEVYKTINCGLNGFLHEFIAIEDEVEFDVCELKLAFKSYVSIAEVYAFSSGALPAWVQEWKPPLNKADLLIFASHSGDENLFFAGVIPYYASERCLTVQVVYLVDHSETHDRVHEQLDTLWASGIRNYPVMGKFPDVASVSLDRNSSKFDTLSQLSSSGFTFQDIVQFVTLNIRRFRPLVVLSHDTYGEHGDGMHILCAEAVIEASKKSGDYNEYTEDIINNFTWTPEKIYLHLYEEGKITLNLDENYGGIGMKTPFEVSSDAYRFQKTQIDTILGKWLLGTETAPIKKATDIVYYSPCEYGLFFTSVGEDTVGGDLFENVIPYAQRDTHLDDESPIFPELDTEVVTEAPETESEDFETSDEKPDKAPVNRKAVTVIIVITSVIVCVLIVIFTVASSKTSVRSRRKRKQDRKNKVN